MFLQMRGGESRDPRGKESHESVAEEGRREGRLEERQTIEIPRVYCLVQ